MRQFRDDDGKLWEALAAEAVVAHMKPGAVLAFRPADEPDAEPIRGTVTFNSARAAEFAIRTLGDKELLRRLSLARATV